ncbi:uncharacterized protein LOC129943281 [Eupeodes corollae]|uniref:uncharacterized protein LOC129943281 n=1 Tax=Eupeodes corollae TaxID=290404 RepID=UPI002493898B|nr:uncharacterized protein LOC129943281 [Eupeodes corollae]
MEMDVNLSTKKIGAIEGVLGGGLGLSPNSPVAKSGCCMLRMNLRTKQHRTPQEVYFESRGKSCKKLLKFNGNSNKILLYPEEGWARTAASSYWTITPCWWQPNRCRIEEFMGSQRQVTKAKMLPMDKGSLLILGHFNRKQSTETEFKLYLSSNISMEDYNMGYCLTGFVERRCPQTNAFQMTHFAVIKRAWPSIANDCKTT